MHRTKCLSLSPLQGLRRNPIAMTERPHRIATKDEVEAAVNALATQPVRIQVCNWPSGLHGLDSPGLYSWWADKIGLRQLELAVRYPFSSSRIYAGLAGATRWLLSGKPKRPKVTLRSRIGTRHLCLRSDYSTFRHTLAAILREPLNLVPIGGRRFDNKSEHLLREWMKEHLMVAVYPFPNRDALGDLETKVIQILDPPLNLDGCPDNALRERIKRLRKACL